MAGRNQFPPPVFKSYPIHADGLGEFAGLGMGTSL